MGQEKLVYIASPYAGDVEKNIAFAKAVCRYAVKRGCTPVAAHLLYPQLLDDSSPEERGILMEGGCPVMEMRQC